MPRPGQDTRLKGGCNTSTLTPLNRVLSHARTLGEARHGQTKARREAPTEGSFFAKRASFASAFPLF